MLKEDKIAELPNYLINSKRADGTMFIHFNENAPKPLRDLFLAHYNVANLDYEMFQTACDILSEIYNDIEQNDAVDAVEEMIYERSDDCASVYTYDRLQYLNNNTEDEISDVMHEYGERSIANACAIWYDKQVAEMAFLIKDWINA